MNTADFLYPRDLEVTSTPLKNILFIGSCLSDFYLFHFKGDHPEINFDHVLFNNASDLPHKDSADLDVYDLQYIQLLLRSVLTDAIVRIAENDRAEAPIDWLDLGMGNLARLIHADDGLGFGGRG